MYELTKNFRFESAHRLAKGYKGKCANIHGHSWNGKLTIMCKTLDGYDFAIDFAILKEFLKKVEDRFDHKMLVHCEDLPIIELCVSGDYGFVPFVDNPTSEVIAKYIYRWARRYFGINDSMVIKSVTIEETCTSKCVYYE